MTFSLSIKRYLKRLLINRTFTVLKGNLKGIKLIISPFLNASVIWKNYEPDKQMALKIFGKELPNFFDIGANVGLHSLLMAKQFPQHTIFAIEPLPENFDYLKKVVQLNDFKNVRLLQSACGATNGEIFFSEGETTLQGHITQDNTALKVQIATLDSIIEKCNMLPSLIKIDVEGAEIDVLEGFTENIAKANPVMIIELHNPRQDRLVADFLIRHDYTIYRLKSNVDDIVAECMLQPIPNLMSTWPDPEGVWGSIVAIPISKMQNYEYMIDRQTSKLSGSVNLTRER